jgi:2-polyprenyl-3-methyl-5-hydroxy-6-metoxy-1,4-benzoquinol methylase
MKENLNTFKKAYSIEFKFYDENQWYLNLYSKYLINTVKKRSVKKILSLGVGFQVISESIISLFESHLLKYCIVEGSIDIIEKFKKEHNTEKIDLVHSYFEDFNTAEKYDAIEMGFVLEHVDNPQLIINRFKKFLTPDGIIFISVPNAKSLHRLIGNKAGLLQNIHELSDYDLQLGHKRYFDLDILTQLISSCGLKVISKKGLMLKPITGKQIETLNWDSKIIDALMDIGEDYPEISNCIYIEVTK